MSAGKKLIQSLQEAVDGNFARITHNGQTWVRIEEVRDAEERVRRECGAEHDALRDGLKHALHLVNLIGESQWQREIREVINAALSPSRPKGEG